MIEPLILKELFALESTEIDGFSARRESDLLILNNLNGENLAKCLNFFI